MRSEQIARQVSGLLGRQFERVLSGNPNLSPEQAGLIFFLLNEVLSTWRRPTSTRPTNLQAHLASRSKSVEMVRGRVRNIAHQGSAADILPHARSLLADFKLLNGRPSFPIVVESPFGRAKFADYLRGVLIELVHLCVHADLENDSAAENEAIRQLCIALGQRYPGSAIEVRVPPLAATQVAWHSEGPNHSRGNPPNVVELKPIDFFELATGQTSYDELVKSGSLQASGVHADQISRMFPLVTPVY